MVVFTEIYVDCAVLLRPSRAPAGAILSRDLRTLRAFIICTEPMAVASSDAPAGKKAKRKQVKNDGTVEAPASDIAAAPSSKPGSNKRKKLADAEAAVSTQDANAAGADAAQAAPAAAGDAPTKPNKRRRCSRAQAPWPMHVTIAVVQTAASRDRYSQIFTVCSPGKSRVTSRQRMRPPRSWLAGRIRRSDRQALLTIAAVADLSRTGAAPMLLSRLGLSHLQTEL